MNVKQLVSFGNFLLEKMNAQREFNGQTLDRRVTDADLSQWAIAWGDPIPEENEQDGMAPQYKYGDIVNLSFGSILKYQGAKVIKTHLTDKHIGYDLEFKVPVTQGPNGQTMGEVTERLYNISQIYLSKN